MNKQIKISVLFFILTLSYIAQAQFSEIGKPFIENFSPKNYKHENQNFSITQDTNGVVYFGNLDGVMQFDGQSWRIMEFKGKPYLTTTDTGEIFVGGYQTFGQLVNTAAFKMEYKPLSNKLWDLGYEFDHVNRILKFKNYVVVLASPHVFVIAPDKSVEHILTSENGIAIFGDKEPLVLLDSGLFKINLQELDTNICTCKQFRNIENII